ncbi:MAG: HYR domain-containing protein [Saprospirales bacterium]|nr:MAG: HYR domain-containing protein [Saprospirales bacterium]
METKRNFKHLFYEQIRRCLPPIYFICWFALSLPGFSIANNPSDQFQEGMAVLAPGLEIIAIEDLVCPGIENGFLHLSVVGDFPPYAVEWEFDGLVDPLPLFNEPENDNLQFFSVGVGTLIVTVTDVEGGQVTGEFVFFGITSSPEIEVSPSISECENGKVMVDYDADFISILSGGISNEDGPIASYPFDDELLPPGDYFVFLEYEYTADPDLGSVQPSVVCSEEISLSVPLLSLDFILRDPEFQIEGCKGRGTGEHSELIDISSWQWGTSARNSFGDTLAQNSGSIDSFVFDWEILFPPGCSKEEVEEIEIKIYDPDSECDTAIIILIDPIDTLKISINPDESGQGVISGEISGDSSLVDVHLEKLDTSSGEYVVVDSIIGLELDSNGMAQVVFEGLSEGEYRLRVTDECECSKTSDPIEIEGPPPPITAEVEGIAPTDSSQSDGQIKITITEGANDTFNIVLVEIDSITGDTLSIETISDAVADSMGCIILAELSPGLYIVEVSDPKGLRETFVSAPVSVPPWECEMEITFGSSVVPITCAGDSTLVTAIVLSGVPPYVYSFSTGDVQGPTPNSNAITPVPAGTHYVTITDDQPCERIDSITITEPEAITVEVICSESSICLGDTVTISASGMGGTGSLTFEWSNGESGESIEVTSSGEYCVTVTDDNGCEHVACCEIEKCPQIEAEASGTAPTDSTNSDGQIKITVNEGANDTFDVIVVRIDTLTGDTISIDTLIGVVADSMGCIVIGDLVPGSYELEVSDPSGERDPWGGSSEIPPFESEPECDISVAIVCPSTLICPGDSADFVLSAIVTGGSGSYTLSWSTGESTEDITVDEDGTYCVTVVDDSIPDCEDEACCEIEIEECPEIVVDSIVCSVICPMDSTGTASVYAHGGCEPLSYEWSNGESGASIGGLSAGTYCVTITDAQGCKVTVCCDVIEEDDENPVAECVDELEVFLDENCEATISPEDIDNGSTDNCGIQSMELDRTDFGCDDVDLSPITVTLTVTDVAGNTGTCEALVSVFDTIPPSIICPADITVDTDPGLCNALLLFPPAMADDNCGLADPPIVNDGPIGDGFANITGIYGLGEIVITFTAEDVKGNQSQCTTTVKVEDNEKPVVICPPNQTIYMEDPFCQGIADYPPATATDNCGISHITYSIPLGEIIFPIFNNTVLVTAFDVNGNFDTCTFELILEDTIAPKILGCPTGTVVVPTDPDECFATNPYNVVITDNCPGLVTIFDPPQGFQYPLGNTPVTITAIDASNNTTTCSFSVTVEDDQPPTFTLCPTNFTVFTNPGECSGNAVFSFIAVDNCTPVTFSSNFNSGDLFPIGTSTVVIVASDGFNNQSTCSFNVTVEDNENPEAVCQNATISLNANGMATLSPLLVDNGSTDNCGIVSRVVSPNMFNCSDIGMDSVVLTVSDAAGNVDSCSAEVTIVDNLPPTATCKDLTVHLNAMGSYDLDPQDIDDNSTDNCGIETWNAVPNTFSCANIGQVNVVLTVIDSSGNTDNCNAMVTVLDTIKPDANCIAGPLVLDLGGLNQITLLPADIDNMSTDNCTIANMSLSQEIFTCDDLEVLVGGIMVTLTVTDQSGNTDECQTEVEITDITPPVALCRSGVAYLDENGEVILNPNVVDNGSDDNCDFSLSVFPNAFDCNNIGDTIIVTLTAVDSSGNQDDCLTFVTVADSLPPDLSCPDDFLLIIAPGETEGFVALDSAMATDNCTNVTIVNSYNAGGADASDTYPLGTTSVVFTATDDFGNVSDCETEVIVSNLPTQTIAGEVYTENFTSINEAFMHVTDTMGNVVLVDTTNTDGEYEFSLPWGSTVTVSPVKDTNHLDGVTTISLIIIQRHILLIDTLNSPYKMIAADINKDGVISTSDLVEMQSVILGILPNFLNNTSYRFTPEDYVFANPSNPLLENWPEEKTYVNITQDSLNEDWVAIKIGDVIGATTGMRYISGEVDFLLEAVKNEDGTTDIVMGPAYDFYLSGYQLELELDPAQLSLLEIDFDRSSLPGITHNNFHFDKENAVLRTNWWNQQDISLQAENEFFRLRVKEGLDKVDLSSAIKLNLRGSLWESEAYAGNGTQWLRPNLLWKEKYTTAEYKLYQNRPNPFTGETIISFLLPKPMDAVLEVSDVDGRVVKRLEIPAREGLNEFSLETGELSEGIYFYRVMTDQWSATKKMILMR